MAKAQRKDEILKSELPPTLPLMALRSTIVYPLGTIAVQMGAPENLALLRAHEEPGLIVGAGRRQRRSRRADRPRSDSSDASASRRACTSASTCRATRSRSRCRGCGASSIEAIEQTRAVSRSRAITPARETPADPTELDDLVARVVSAAETLAELVDRIPGRGAGDPQDERLRSGPVRRPRGDEHELPDRRQGRSAAAPRRRPAPALHPLAPRARGRARARDGGREAADRDQDRAAPARVLSAPAAARDPGRARRGRSRREGSDRAAEEDRRGEAARESRRRRRGARRSGCACSRRRRASIRSIRTYLDWVLSLPWNKRSGDRGDRPQEGRGGARRPALRARRGEGAHHRVPRRAQAARRRSARPDSLLRRTAGHRQDVARRGDRARRSAASSIASPWAACATRPRFADTGARTSARCRGCSSRRCAASAVRDPGADDRRDRQDVGRRPVAAIRRRRCSRCSIRRRTTTFVDHYLNLPFDLSTVPVHLHGEQPVRHPGAAARPHGGHPIAGYTIEEKVEIAWRYLLPRLLEEHGITDKDLQFTDEVAGVHLEPLLARGGAAQLRAQPRGDHAQARAQEGRRRRGRVGHRRRRRSRKCSALRATRRRKRRRSRRSAPSPGSRGRRPAATS